MTELRDSVMEYLGLLRQPHAPRVHREHILRSCPVCHTETYNEYCSTGCRRKATARQKREKSMTRDGWLEREAHRLIKEAVDRGQIIKPLFCSVCHETGPVYPVHTRGYEQPLAVIWACKKCKKGM